MSTAIMSKAWPLKMPPTPKSVLISLSDNANDAGYCWPSLETIAERTCFSKRAVIEAIKWLELNGYLTADRSNGRHTSYQLAHKTWHLITPEVLKTGASDAPVQEIHRCISRKNNDEPVHLAPKPVQEMHSNRQEPSLKAKATVKGVPSDKPKVSPRMSFEKWIAGLPEGEKPIPESDPIFDYAEKAGIPIDFLRLAWLMFREDMIAKGNKQAGSVGWREHFRKYIRGNWYRLWFFDGEGQCVLTTAGYQAQKVAA